MCYAVKVMVVVFCTIILSDANSSAQSAINHNRVDSTTARITVGKQGLQYLSPNIFGQFIEFLGRCINGGVYDKASPLADESGFRKDVMEKVKALAPPLLRYPGGTFSKIYHWQGGIGPVCDRPKRKNLIWGGIEDNAFGTAEFITYCRKIGAEPFLVVNMATGTPEEAAHWVEYCNGTEDTYYANLRRAQGYAEPFNVKYWGLGNEEEAATDPGMLQDAHVYAQTAWQYIKLMKLNDTSLQLIVAGVTPKWDEVVVKELSGAANYLSMHLYASGTLGKPASLFENIQSFEADLAKLKPLLNNAGGKVKNWSKWYRFPARRGPIQLAIDEWGIWKDANSAANTFEAPYTWQDALGTASFLNLFQRNSTYVGMATWAQMVNTLAPITTNRQGSTYQTVFYPLAYYRKYAGSQSLPVNVQSPLLAGSAKAQSLDVSATYNQKGKLLTVFVVNRSANNIKASIRLPGVPVGNITLVNLTAGLPNSPEPVTISQQTCNYTG